MTRAVLNCFCRLSRARTGSRTKPTLAVSTPTETSLLYLVSASPEQTAWPSAVRRSAARAQALVVLCRPARLPVPALCRRAQLPAPVNRVLAPAGARAAARPVLTGCRTRTTGVPKALRRTSSLYPASVCRAPTVSKSAANRSRDRAPVAPAQASAAPVIPAPVARARPVRAARRPPAPITRSRANTSGKISTARLNLSGTSLRRICRVTLIPLARACAASRLPSYVFPAKQNVNPIYACVCLSLVALISSLVVSLTVLALFVGSIALSHHRKAAPTLLVILRVSVTASKASFVRHCSSSRRVPVSRSAVVSAVSPAAAPAPAPARHPARAVVRAERLLCRAKSTMAAPSTISS